MNTVIRIGTRESQLALWQATQVKNLLEQHGHPAQLVAVKSDGDIDLKTPLYEMGVQGIFTRSLDIALIENRIDIAVHSMKDVPTRLPMGIVQASVLKRGPVSDLLVYRINEDFLTEEEKISVIATSSIRRKAQWLNRFPHHQLVNLRGNVNTRLQKLKVSEWDGAIFAQAGLERINVRPENSTVLNWMLPAPAQGAIMIVCRKNDEPTLEACSKFNHADTNL
ncbi:MAG: hydroxymethylbilane synthase, partial [Chitinophagaceae bacterium]